jgi:hypothetical protein
VMSTSMVWAARGKPDGKVHKHAKRKSFERRTRVGSISVEDSGFEETGIRDYSWRGRANWVEHKG